MTSAIINRNNHLTTKEAAKKFGVTLRSVQIWCEQGLLPCGKTPGGHRRMHTAHVRLLAYRMSKGLPRPTSGDYAAAELAYEVQPGGIALSEQQVRKRRSFEVLVTDAAWLLAQHQEARMAAGVAPMRTQSGGGLEFAADVVAQEAFRKGVMFALSFMRLPGEAE